MAKQAIPYPRLVGNEFMQIGFYNRNLKIGCFVFYLASLYNEVL